jgi:hypothetical protein
MRTLFMLSLLVLGFGVVLLSLSGISFKFRALCNKPAWGGATVPILFMGLGFFMPGLVLLFIFMPR